MQLKTCSACGQQFSCGMASGTNLCWCCDYPTILPLDSIQDCRCPACLKEIVKEKIAEYVQSITPTMRLPVFLRNMSRAVNR
jgi:hypothetical protein